MLSFERCLILFSSFPLLLAFVVGGLVFEFRVFVAGWRHALRSEWPFIIIVTTSATAPAPPPKNATRITPGQGGFQPVPPSPLAGNNNIAPNTSLSKACAGPSSRLRPPGRSRMSRTAGPKQISQCNRVLNAATYLCRPSPRAAIHYSHTGVRHALWTEWPFISIISV